MSPSTEPPASGDALAALSTCPDEAQARRLGSGLLTPRMAACVNVLPAIRSIYRWKGEVHEDGEALMIFKSRRSACPELEAGLVEHHPYEVPEVLALPVALGAPACLDWLRKETQGE